MMKKRVFWSVLAVLMAVLLFTGCLPNVVDNDSFVVEERVLAPALLGSWEMTSVHWVTADTTYSNAKVQPGIFMIDGHR
ncbi:MAG TPA: hypothetical protein ENJ82_04840, partial [Bacteroidetes bacterium]|nr:hypothetical protein [Bacteroidota bacterium]